MSDQVYDKKSIEQLLFQGRLLLNSFHQNPENTDLISLKLLLDLEPWKELYDYSNLLIDSGENKLAYQIIEEIYSITGDIGVLNLLIDCLIKMLYWENPTLILAFQVI